MSWNYLVSPGKISVSRFPEKSSDSRNNFGFVPKQRLLELSPPVTVGESRIELLYNIMYVKVMTVEDSQI